MHRGLGVPLCPLAWRVHRKGTPGRVHRGGLQTRVESHAGQAEHAGLEKRFADLQRGFAMGELQDDLKESLMADFGSGPVDSEIVGEESAMQKLIQQLKDAKEAVLNSQDDMNYWKVAMSPPCPRHVPVMSPSYPRHVPVMPPSRPSRPSASHSGRGVGRGVGRGRSSTRGSRTSWGRWSLLGMTNRHLRRDDRR